MIKYLLVLICCLSPLILLGQEPFVDSTTSTTSEDTVPVDTLRATESSGVDTGKVSFFNKVIRKTYPNPERAAAMSFLIPGSGQIYNKKLWFVKVPVIYAGYAGLILVGENRRMAKNVFEEAYLSALKGEPHAFTGTRQDNPNTLRILRNENDKAFQLAYIGVGILHLIQTLEAYTSAHLLEFDMDESLSFSPTLMMPDPNGSMGLKPGLRVSIPLSK